MSNNLTPPYPCDQHNDASSIPVRVVSNSTNYTGIADVQPLVNTTAYSAGQSVGGLLTFNGMVRTGQTGGWIQQALVAFAGTQTPTLDLFLFNQNPSSSTVANGATFSLAAADMGKCVGVLHVNDTSSAGTATISQALNQALSYSGANAGGALYGVIVTRAALTPSAANAMIVTLVGPQD